MIELQQVTQRYPAPDGEGEITVVKDLSLTIDKPCITMVLGPSGCGKSTILRMMGGVRPIGVVTPTEGQVLIDGQPCDGPHDDAVMVFQQYANRPDLTVEENVKVVHVAVAPDAWREELGQLTNRPLHLELGKLHLSHDCRTD